MRGDGRAGREKEKQGRIKKDLKHVYFQVKCEGKGGDIAAEDDEMIRSYLTLWHLSRVIFIAHSLQLKNIRFPQPFVIIFHYIFINMT